MIFDVLVFVAGLSIGSFISALSWRYPKKISIAKGRSICPNCRHQISWFDNIPLLSFLLLGGTCRNCKKPISWRYPVIELATGIGFILIGVNIFYLIIFCLLELIFIIDLEHQIIPDVFVFAGIVLVFAFKPMPFTNLFSGFLAALFLMLIHLATRGRGMGLGDVKFAALGGLLTGLSLMPVWLFVSFLTGGLVGSILLLTKKAGLKDKIAFGPFLVISIPLALIWGEKIMRILLLR